MPDRPSWIHRLDNALQQLEAFPSPWVDRATLELVLGIGRRRAQQILQPFVRHIIGRNGLADRQELIHHLRRLAAGDAAHYEKQRRRRLCSFLHQAQQDARHQPRVLVEAPTAVVNQVFESLPPGVRLAPGSITLEGFTTPDEAKRYLLALIMAMGNDPDGFESRIALSPKPACPTTP